MLSQGLKSIDDVEKWFKHMGANFNRNDLIKNLYKNYSIKCAVQYYPLYKYPLFKKMGFEKHKCKNTEKFFNNMISFPFHIWMSDKQFNYMISSVKKVLIYLRKLNGKK